ncbi:MAG: sarcosine oxidase subunit delta [Rhodobacterales bacterium]|nr:sarcosine oxidase subunit delta [Rhodobacterales bacterium]
MRIKCPICGARDRREFYYVGDAMALARPDADADAAVWDDYIHNRDNPAGMTRDLWYHESGCSAWIVVTRSTVTHEISKVELASKVAGKMTGAPV